MPPQLAALAVFGLQELIKRFPELYASLSQLFTRKEPPTDAEWDELRAKITSKSYKDYVPTTALPDEETAT
jgi:hypothetical protein